MEVVPLILETQQLLAKQQVQLSEAMSAVHRQAAVQQEIAAEQAKAASMLKAVAKELGKERKLQKAAAYYLAAGGKQRARSPAPRRPGNHSKPAPQQRERTLEAPLATGPQLYVRA